jgi:hypothetical protein
MNRGLRAVLLACVVSCSFGISLAASRPPTPRSKSSSLPTGSSAPDKGVWHGFGGIGDGCAGPIGATAIAPNGDLYVGGSFSMCGNTPASSIARWNGSTWSALGSGIDNRVNAIAISGNDVYAVGQFSTAGGVPVSGIARWDGTQWSALGAGISGSDGYYDVFSVTAQGDDVYVGGRFDRAGGAPANSIAHWNKSTQAWTALGNGIVQGSSRGDVNALTLFNGSLYVGGYFDHAGAGTALNLAAWNGSSWSPTGTGIDGEVHAIAAWNGSLYAGGNLQFADGQPVNNLVRWSGTAWVDVGGGTNGEVDALTSNILGLFVGGGFDEAGGSAHANLALWNGSTWSDVSGGVQSPFFYRIVLSIAAGVNALYVGGDFTSVGGDAVNAHFIAGWNGFAWTALQAPAGKGLYSLPQPSAAVTVAGKPCFGGFWELYPGAGNIACWDGSTWTPLGGDIANDLPLWVDSLFVSGTDLYVAGYYNIGTGCCIGRWDGVAWNALGDGIDSDPITMTVDGDNVYVSGYFQNAGGAPANHMAMWDGAAWHALGDGIDNPPSALAVFQGKLYAAGYFSDAGGVPANYIAMWDGANWSAVGSGLDGQGNALVVHDGALYVAGGFSQAGGVPANSIARWNGSQWSAVTTPLGNGVTYTGIPGYVTTLAETNLGLFVGGFFDDAGGSPVTHIARWDGTDFHALGAGSGIDPNGYVMAITIAGTDVYVGGQFASAGGHLTSNVARFATDDIFANGFD